MAVTTLRSGIFMGPHHPVDEDPTLALRRDIELIEWLDRLGFEEAWIGEHHSAGFEIISSPELMIAAAAERTKRIRLGTGVVSLPYHNPLMVANRILQLDHMTMGRVMFGAGPGLLTTDAMMLGIDPMAQRDRMMESLEIILRLFRGETVTYQSDWISLHDARVHLLPYTKPYPEVAVASMMTPSGGRAAGRLGLGMLCLGASMPDGFSALDTNWRIAQELAAEDGRVMDPSCLRIVGQMHLAETREKARENLRFGFRKWLDYTNTIAPARYTHLVGHDPIEKLVETGEIVVGTPDDAIAYVQRFYDKQGEFGCMLQQALDWADFDQTKRSFELYARYVVPHFRRANAARTASLGWAGENSQDFAARRARAAQAMIAQHAAEQATKIERNAAE